MERGLKLDKKYLVIANDDAMKYQVIDTDTSKVKYEHDAENQALEVCHLMNEAYYTLLDGVYERTLDAWKSVTEKDVPTKMKQQFKKEIYKKEHESTFISVMSKEFLLQLVDNF